MHDFKLHRRQVFQGLIALSAVGGIAACSEQTESSSGAAEDPANTSGVFGSADMALISALSETLIPKTDTASAIEAGVPGTLQALATDWGDEGFQSYWLTGLANLRTVLNERAGARFETLEHSKRGEVLSGYDHAVFDGDIEDGFYRDFKNTVIQAFYMSEPGATEALAYEPVPGEWIGCVPLSDYPKNWAT